MNPALLQKGSNSFRTDSEIKDHEGSEYGTLRLIKVTKMTCSNDLSIKGAIRPTNKNASTAKIEVSDLGPSWPWILMYFT